MRGIDGDGRQQRIDLALEVTAGEIGGVLAQFAPGEQPDALLAQLLRQLLVPALVLRGHKAVNFGSEDGKGLVRAQAVVAGFAVAVFNALQQAGLADFNVFVEVGAGDGQEFDALQQGVGGVFSLFEHTAIELHPGVVPAVEKLGFPCASGHTPVSGAVLESLSRLLAFWHPRGPR